MLRKIIAMQLAFFCAVGNTGLFAVAEEEPEQPDMVEETDQEQESETEAAVSGVPDNHEETEIIYDPAGTELSAEEDDSAEEIEEINEYISKTEPNADAAEAVSYIERSWDGTEVNYETKTRDNVNTVPDNGAMTSGWYYLNSNVTVNDRIYLTGDTWLILGDNCTLDIKGLYVPQGSRLTIYAQSDGDNTGKLISKPNSGGAGIGAARDNHPGGNIVIHGGNIEAKGDDHCAGIGSNDGNGTTAPIMIYGGTINAKGGSDGAGIGGGRDCSGGTITIDGGTITAWSRDGACIGGGDNGDSGTIIINSGTITVSGTAGGNFTINVSALSYVRSVLNSDKYKGDAQNAVMALYKYYEAVMGYRQ